MPEPLSVGIFGGGGKNAFFAHLHERGVFFDGTRRITCAALRHDPVLAMEAANEWPYPIKGYPDSDTMIKEEAKKPVGSMDYVIITTPNHLHYTEAMQCLNAGFPVLCEKPLTMTVEEAEAIERKVKQSGTPFGIVHTYAYGHWTSLFSRFIVNSGLLGEIRRVDVHYYQGWLADSIERNGVQQAEWRVDPARAGISGCGGDIGTHAFMQLRFVTGLEVSEILYAKLTAFVPGRELDDNFTTICELSNGAEAHICASQVMIGHKNDLVLEITGTNGSLVWSQEKSEKVVIHLPGEPDRVYWRGEVTPHDGFLADIPPELLAESKTPSGHAEGIHDALARIHRHFEIDVRRYQEGLPPVLSGYGYADVHDGVEHMRFIEAAVKSSAEKTPVILQH